MFTAARVYTYTYTCTNTEWIVHCSAHLQGPQQTVPGLCPVDKQPQSTICQAARHSTCRQPADTPQNPYFTHITAPKPTCMLLHESSTLTKAKPLYMQAASSRESSLGCHFKRHIPPPVDTCTQQGTNKWVVGAPAIGKGDYKATHMHAIKSRAIPWEPS